MSRWKLAATEAEAMPASRREPASPSAPSLAQPTRATPAGTTGERRDTPRAKPSRAAQTPPPGKTEPVTPGDEGDAPAAAPVPDEARQGEVYICPMHCVPKGSDHEYTSAVPGDCPVCGMHLVKQQPDAAGHD